MSDKKRYIDQAGLKFFYTNLKKVFRTEVQVAAQINRTGQSVTTVEMLCRL